MDVLTYSPLIGRKVKGKAELVIGRASRGYVVSHRFPDIDTVFACAAKPTRVRLQAAVESVMIGPESLSAQF